MTPSVKMRFKIPDDLPTLPEILAAVEKLDRERIARAFAVMRWAVDWAMKERAVAVQRSAQQAVVLEKIERGLVQLSPVLRRIMGKVGSDEAAFLKRFIRDS